MKGILGRKVAGVAKYFWDLPKLPLKNIAT